MVAVKEKKDSFPTGKLKTKDKKNDDHFGIRHGSQTGISGAKHQARKNSEKWVLLHFGPYKSS
jgi:hypothetical protein